MKFSRIGLVGTAALMAVALLCALSASASAEVRFCSSGSGAGECEQPRGIAVDGAADRVYVADSGNNRINVFDSAGNFLMAFGWGVADGTTNSAQACGPSATPPTASCFQGIPGSGPGQFRNPQWVAVDLDPTSSAFHDLYVVDGEQDAYRVQRFDPAGDFVLAFGEGRFKNPSADPIAVGPNGTVSVVDSSPLSSGQGFALRIDRFQPSGALIDEIPLPGEERISALAADLNGDYYIRWRSTVEKFDGSGTLLYTLPLDNAEALAVDGFGNLFASHLDGPSWVISEFEAGGEVVRRFGYGTLVESPAAMAVSPAGIYATEAFLDRVLTFAPPPDGPLACCLDPSVGNTKATLKGGVNPEGKVTTYHFEYLTDADFKANGNDFTGPEPATATPESPPMGPDFNLHDAEAEIGCTEAGGPLCLLTETTYHYRLVATNSDGESIAEGEFETKPPFEIIDTFASDVSSDSAILHAVVDPSGNPTTGYFQYVTDAAYQADLQLGGDGFAAAEAAPDVDSGQAPVNFGSGEGPKAAAVQLSKLATGTVYHYRLVASAASVEVPGPERVFNTFPLQSPPSNSCPNAAFRIGPSANLPDCRAYEMVSPVDKNGGDIKVLGNAKSYPARLDQGSADGERFAYSSVTSFAGALSAPWSSQYLATRQPGVGWATQAINAPREGASSLSDNTFIKLDAPYKAFSGDLSSGWLLQDANPVLDECAPAGFPGLYRRDAATGSYEALSIAKPKNQSAEQYVLELQGVSADGTHSVFRANARLTRDASSASSGETAAFQLYEHVRDEESCGELRLVSVLPDGSASKLGNSAGTSADSPGEFRANRTAHSVSDDGSRIFWTAAPAGFDRGQLYVRIDGQKTIQIASGAAQFWTASSDGSTAIYSVGEELLEFDVDKALAGEEATNLIAGEVIGVAGADQDASRIYFVSEEALAGQGEEGEPNLYLATGGGVDFVATLNGSDPTLPPGGDVSPNFSDSGFTVGTVKPISNGVRVTPDGRHLAFVSTASLTGYDNRDVADGRPALEIFIHDADTGELACVSCNPTGARPKARAFGPQDGYTRRVSAQMPPGENQLFGPRVLTDDGNSLFFESFEALLPRDTNGKADAYEWQRAGSQAECGSMGAELYIESSGGCLSLISTGQSQIDTEIADATPDGSSVFLRTAESLLPQDPGQVDVYVARVNGGFPQPPPLPAACEGEACQGPIAPPSDPTPASLGFAGAGNVAQPPRKPRCRKGKVRRKGRCVTKKHGAKKNKPGKQRRRLHAR